MSEPLEIVHHDEWIVAVNKPSGMLVHRGWAQDDDVVVDRLHAQLGARVWPLHRLDRATSGVLLFALDVDTARNLGRAFETGEIHKRYVALVRGHPPEQLLIDYALRKVDSDSPERQDARTEIRRLDLFEAPRSPADAEPSGEHRFERYALVEATPLTGRTHQIRRHLKHISHPIIGDVRYGKGEHNRMFRQRFGLHRLALHALAVELLHPVSGAVLRVEAPLPADLAEPLASMGLALGQNPEIPGTWTR